jgi:hypothetical protein
MLKDCIKALSYKEALQKNPSNVQGKIILDAETMNRNFINVCRPACLCC